MRTTNCFYYTVSAHFNSWAVCSTLANVKIANQSHFTLSKFRLDVSARLQLKRHVGAQRLNGRTKTNTVAGREPLTFTGSRLLVFKPPSSVKWFHWFCRRRCARCLNQWRQQKRSGIILPLLWAFTYLLTYFGLRGLALALQTHLLSFPCYISLMYPTLTSCLRHLHFLKVLCFNWP